MITVERITGIAFTVTLDVADSRAIRKLADAYSIPFDAMLVGCINKGIDNISEGITKKADPRVPDSDEPEQS